MQSPVKKKHVENAGLSSPECSDSFRDISSEEQLDTPPKLGGVDPHCHRSESPLADPSELPTSTSSEPSAILSRFQRHFPLFYSFIGCYRHIENTPYHGPSGTHPENELVIMCVGFKDDQQEAGVASSFESLRVVLVNEEVPRAISLRRTSFAFLPLPNSFSGFKRVHDSARSLFHHLPDCFCVVPMLSCDTVIFKVFVLHVYYRPLEVGPFPQTWEGIKIYYFVEFVQRGVSTRSQSHQRGLSVSNGTKILLQRTGASEIITSTLGRIVRRENLYYLLTTAHSLPNFLPYSTSNVDSYEHVVSVGLGRKFCTQRKKFSEKEEHTMVLTELITRNAPVGSVMVCNGNYRSCTRDELLVYTDAALIPINVKVDYDPIVIATKEQWEEEKPRSNLRNTIKMDCQFDTVACAWADDFTPISFTNKVATCSSLQTSQLFFKNGAGTSVTYARYEGFVPCRLLNLSRVQKSVGGLVSCDIDFGNLLITCHSCLVLHPFYNSSPFAQEGDSGALVYDVKGNVVGIYHAGGTDQCYYVCPMDQVQYLLDFTFV
ncbi:hypothetical protein RCL1_001552 [Eukaryota sp. TZLM3-RCL]